jgi:rubrerythrin
MLFTTALLLPLAAPTTRSNPFKRWTTPPTDVQVLQYALTLEHLEATFYAQALDKFSAQDFTDAGFPDWVRGRTSQIAMHEASHVKLLSAALGNMSTPACEYAFPYTDVKSFLGLASALENIGVSAYAGANQYITDATYSTVAATILGVEARHQGFFNGAVLSGADWTYVSFTHPCILCSRLLDV